MAFFFGQLDQNLIPSGLPSVWAKGCSPAERALTNNLRSGEKQKQKQQTTPSVTTPAPPPTKREPKYKEVEELVEVVKQKQIPVNPNPPNPRKRHQCFCENDWDGHYHCHFCGIECHSKNVLQEHERDLCEDARDVRTFGCKFEPEYTFEKVVKLVEIPEEDVEYVWPQTEIIEPLKESNIDWKAVADHHPVRDFKTDNPRGQAVVNFANAALDAAKEGVTRVVSKDFYWGTIPLEVTFSSNHGENVVKVSEYPVYGPQRPTSYKQGVFTRKVIRNVEVKQRVRVPREYRKVPEEFRDTQPAKARINIPFDHSRFCTCLDCIKVHQRRSLNTISRTKKRSDKNAVFTHRENLKSLNKQSRTKIRTSTIPQFKKNPRDKFCWEEKIVVEKQEVEQTCITRGFYKAISKAQQAKVRKEVREGRLRITDNYEVRFEPTVQTKQVEESYLRKRKFIKTNLKDLLELSQVTELDQEIAWIEAKTGTTTKKTRFNSAAQKLSEKDSSFKPDIRGQCWRNIFEHHLKFGRISSFPGAEYLPGLQKDTSRFVPYKSFINWLQKEVILEPTLGDLIVPHPYFYRSSGRLIAHVGYWKGAPWTKITELISTSKAWDMDPKLSSVYKHAVVGAATTNMESVHTTLSEFEEDFDEEMSPAVQLHYELHRTASQSGSPMHGRTQSRLPSRPLPREARNRQERVVLQRSGASTTAYVSPNDAEELRVGLAEALLYSTQNGSNTQNSSNSWIGMLFAQNRLLSKYLSLSHGKPARLMKPIALALLAEGVDRSIQNMSGTWLDLKISSIIMKSCVRMSKYTVQAWCAQKFARELWSITFEECVSHVSQVTQRVTEQYTQEVEATRNWYNSMPTWVKMTLIGLFFAASVKIVHQLMGIKTEPVKVQNADGTFTESVRISVHTKQGFREDGVRNKVKYITTALGMIGTICVFIDVNSAKYIRDWIELWVYCLTNATQMGQLSDWVSNPSQFMTNMMRDRFAGGNITEERIDRMFKDAADRAAVKSGIERTAPELLMNLLGEAEVQHEKQALGDKSVMGETQGYTIAEILEQTTQAPSTLLQRFQGMRRESADANSFRQLALHLTSQDPAWNEVFLTAPTGAGKSTIFPLQLRRAGAKRILVMIPLVAATMGVHKRLESESGIACGYHADHISHNPSAPIVVSTYGHVANSLMHGNNPFDGFTHVLADECHVITLETVLVMDHLTLNSGASSYKLVFMTATPFENLTLSSVRTEKDIQMVKTHHYQSPSELVDYILQGGEERKREFADKGCIIFCSSRRETELQASRLHSEGIPAIAYHSQLRAPLGQFIEANKNVLGQIPYFLFTTNAIESGVTVPAYRCIDFAQKMQTTITGDRRGVDMARSVITMHEQLQRRGRIGRTMAGYYEYTHLGTAFKIKLDPDSSVKYLLYCWSKDIYCCKEVLEIPDECLIRVTREKVRNIWGFDSPPMVTASLLDHKGHVYQNASTFLSAFQLQPGLLDHTSETLNAVTLSQFETMELPQNDAGDPIILHVPQVHHWFRSPKVTLLWQKFEQEVVTNVPEGEQRARRTRIMDRLGMQIAANDRMTNATLAAMAAQFEAEIDGHLKSIEAQEAMQQVWQNNLPFAKSIPITGWALKKLNDQANSTIENMKMEIEQRKLAIDFILSHLKNDTSLRAHIEMDEQNQIKEYVKCLLDTGFMQNHHQSRCLISRSTHKNFSTLVDRNDKGDYILRGYVKRICDFMLAHPFLIGTTAVGMTCAAMWAFLREPQETKGLALLSDEGSKSSKNLDLVHADRTRKLNKMREKQTGQPELVNEGFCQDAYSNAKAYVRNIDLFRRNKKHLTVSQIKNLLDKNEMPGFVVVRNLGEVGERSWFTILKDDEHVISFETTIKEDGNPGYFEVANGLFNAMKGVELSLAVREDEKMKELIKNIELPPDALTGEISYQPEGLHFGDEWVSEIKIDDPKLFCDTPTQLVQSQVLQWLTTGNCDKFTIVRELKAYDDRMAVELSIGDQHICKVWFKQELMNNADKQNACKALLKHIEGLKPSIKTWLIPEGTGKLRSHRQKAAQRAKKSQNIKDGKDITFYDPRADGRIKSGVKRAFRQFYNVDDADVKEIILCGNRGEPLLNVSNLTALNMEIDRLQYSDPELYTFYKQIRSDLEHAEIEIGDDFISNLKGTNWADSENEEVTNMINALDLLVKRASDEAYIPVKVVLNDGREMNANVAKFRGRWQQTTWSAPQHEELREKLNDALKLIPEGFSAVYDGETTPEETERIDLIVAEMVTKKAQQHLKERALPDTMLKVNSCDWTPRVGVIRRKDVSGSFSEVFVQAIALNNIAIFPHHKILEENEMLHFHFPTVSFSGIMKRLPGVEHFDIAYVTMPRKIPGATGGLIIEAPNERKNVFHLSRIVDGKVLTQASYQGYTPTTKIQQGFWTHNNPTAQGSCGGPLLTSDGHLIGYHIGASSAFEYNTYLGFEEPILSAIRRTDRAVKHQKQGLVTMSEVQFYKCCNYMPPLLNNQNPIPPEWGAPPHKDITPCQTPKWMAAELMKGETSFELLGYMRRHVDYNTKISTNTDFREWLASEEGQRLKALVDSDTKTNADRPLEITHTISAQNREAAIKDTSKYNRTTTFDFSDDLLRRATDLVIQQLTGYIKMCTKQPLDLVYQDMEWSTACGARYDGLKGDFRSTVIGETNMDAYGQFCWDRLNVPADEYIPTIWTNSLKDELRPIEKVLINKTRTFTAAPIEFVVGAKQAVDQFNHQFMAAHLQLPHTVGINQWGGGWNKLFQKLSGKDFLYSSGDGTRFDSSPAYYMFDALLTIRKHFADPSLHQALNNLYLEICYTPIVLHDGCIVKKDHGNNSGQCSTVIDNSLIMMLLCAAAYLENTPKSWHSLQTLNHHWHYCVNGDDYIGGMSPALAAHLTREKMSETFSRFQFVYTWEEYSPSLFDQEYMSLRFVNVLCPSGSQPAEVLIAPFRSANRQMSTLAHTTSFAPWIKLQVALTERVKAFVDKPFFDFISAYAKWLEEKYEGTCNTKEWQDVKQLWWTDQQIFNHYFSNEASNNSKSVIMFESMPEGEDVIFGPQDSSIPMANRIMWNKTAVICEAKASKQVIWDTKNNHDEERSSVRAYSVEEEKLQTEDKSGFQTGYCDPNTWCLAPHCSCPNHHWAPNFVKKISLPIRAWDLFINKPLTITQSLKIIGSSSWKATIHGYCWLFAFADFTWDVLEQCLVHRGLEKFKKNAWHCYLKYLGLKSHLKLKEKNESSNGQGDHQSKGKTLKHTKQMAIHHNAVTAYKHHHPRGSHKGDTIERWLKQYYPNMSQTDVTDTMRKIANDRNGQEELTAAPIAPTSDPQSTAYIAPAAAGADAGAQSRPQPQPQPRPQAQAGANAVQALPASFAAKYGNLATAAPPPKIRQDVMSEDNVERVRSRWASLGGLVGSASLSGQPAFWAWMFAYVCRNGTSTDGDLSAEVVLNNQTLRLHQFVSVADEFGGWRRFWRALADDVRDYLTFLQKEGSELPVDWAIKNGFPKDLLTLGFDFSDSCTSISEKERRNIIAVKARAVTRNRGTLIGVSSKPNTGNTEDTYDAVSRDIHRTYEE